MKESRPCTWQIFSLALNYDEEAKREKQKNSKGA